jgi:hypothetical protein
MQITVRRTEYGALRSAAFDISQAFSETKAFGLRNGREIANKCLHTMPW